MRRSVDGPSSAAEDLDIALRVIGETNRTIAAADTKAGLLLSGASLVGAGLATYLGSTSPVLAVWPVRAGAGLVTLGLLVCISYLSATLRPNLRTPPGSNLFAFPSLAVAPSLSGRARATPEVLAQQAWHQAQTLAEIAGCKHRRFAVALRWGEASLIAFLVWFTSAFVLAPIWPV